MKEILQQTLLFDFYGELLTTRQKEVFSMYFFNDLSMAEIGENYSISRQAVNDILKRTEKMLVDYEKRLGLVERHIIINNKIDDILNILKNKNGDFVNSAIDKLNLVKDL